MTTVDALAHLIDALGGDNSGLIGNVGALKRLYETKGGNPEDVADLITIPEIIDSMAYLLEGTVTVSAMDSATELWGYTISQLQTGITVSNGAITGTLNKIESGSLADVWGAGYFIALAFATENAETDKIFVAILPTEGAGWQKLDEDLAAVIKVTDKSTQKIYVRSTDGVNTITQVFNLSGLSLDDK